MLSWLAGEAALPDECSATEVDSDWDEIPDHECADGGYAGCPEPIHISVDAVPGGRQLRPVPQPPCRAPVRWRRAGEGGNADAGLEQAVEQAVEVLFDDMTGLPQLDHGCALLSAAILAVERHRQTRLPPTHVACRLRAKLRDRIARHLELLAAVPPHASSPQRPASGRRFVQRFEGEL